MKKETFVLFTVYIAVLCVMYLFVNSLTYRSFTETKMPWGKFQLVHDEQIKKLTSDNQQRTQPDYSAFKWIIGKSN